MWWDQRSSENRHNDSIRLFWETEWSWNYWTFQWKKVKVCLVTGLVSQWETREYCSTSDSQIGKGIFFFWFSIVYILNLANYLPSFWIKNFLHTRLLIAARFYLLTIVLQQLALTMSPLLSIYLATYLLLNTKLLSIFLYVLY